MENPILSVLKNELTIHRLPPDSPIPKQVYNSGFYSISKTEDELSIVCESSIIVNSQKSEAEWACLKILGPLDFSQIGILSKIASTLAEVKISIFVISTYDTDYVLLKTKNLETAQRSLKLANYKFS